MKKIFLLTAFSHSFSLFLIALICSTTAFSQSKTENLQKVIIRGRCIGQCTGDKLREIASDFASAANYGNQLAIRLCSNERFEIAIAKATGNIFTVFGELKEISKINSDEVTLLLSDDCLQNEVPKQVATDFLILSDGSQPPYIERTNLKNVCVTRIGIVPISREMEKDYPKEAFNDFVKQLQQKPNAYGVVIGFYNRKPSKILKNKVQKIDDKLRKFPDLKDRYTTDIVSYGYYDSDWNFEPKKPVFYIVEVKK